MAGIFASKVPAPKELDVGKALREGLEAQIDLMPRQYEADREFQPKYDLLNLRSFETTMFGDKDQQGMLALQGRMQPEIDRLNAESATYQRTADIADIERLGSRATDALRSQSGNKALLEGLTKQAEADLALGSSLSAADQRMATQSARAAMGARGLIQGNQGIAAEVLNNYGFGQQRQAERRAFAGQVVGLNQATAADPFMALLGRPSQSGAFTQGMAGQGMGFQQQAGTMFNPNIGIQVAQGNQQALNAANIANAQGKNAITGALIGAGGMIAGGTLAGCWIARAAYGEDNPRWHLFRFWLDQYAPKYFRDFYHKYGPAIGESLKTIWGAPFRPVVRAIFNQILRKAELI